MQMNIGGTDKVVRILAGLALLSLVFLLKGSARWFGLVGLVPLVTAFTGFCPLYSVVGVSTSPKK